MQRAIFIDAMGTMLELEPPWERIDRRAVAGIPAERVRDAFEAEMAYYRAHIERGSDPAGLAELRLRRCAALLSAELKREIGVEAMMAAIRFRPYPDVAPALRELRGLGLTVVCVSNWDCSLPDVLGRVGLVALLDGVVSSAVAGARKPDPAIFGPALAIAGCAPSEALHVGDSEEDVTAARAAGIDVLRIDRRGGGEGEIASLAEISKHLAPPAMSDEPLDSQPPPPSPAPSRSLPPPGRPDEMPQAPAAVDDRDYAGIPDTAVRVPQIIGAVFWAIGVSVIGVIVLSLFDPSITDPDLEQPDGIALALQAFAALGFISAAIGMTMIANRGGFGDGLRRLGLLTRPKRPFGTVGLALLMYIGVVAVIAVFLQPQQDDIAENLGADKDASAIVIIAAGFLIIAGAAIGEELFFRGLLFGGLRQLIGLWPAALISGVIFGLPHLPNGDLAVGLQLALFGAILAWAYERSGSLWVPIGMHAMNNSLAFYVLVWG